MRRITTFARWSTDLSPDFVETCASLKRTLFAATSGSELSVPGRYCIFGDIRRLVETGKDLFAEFKARFERVVLARLKQDALVGEFGRESDGQNPAQPLAQNCASYFAERSSLCREPVIFLLLAGSGYYRRCSEKPITFVANYL